jgi:hypothetical protein
MGKSDEWQIRICFLLSEVWVRRTSTNSDGHTILHPPIEGISIIGLGQHAHVLNDVDISPRRLNNSPTISRSEVSVPLRTRESDTVTIDGERTVLDAVKSRIMQVLVQHDNLEIKVRCTAPLQYFDEFEATFSHNFYSLAIVRGVESGDRTLSSG